MTTRLKRLLIPQVDVIPLVEDDLIWLWHWNVEAVDPEWKKWDGPYFGDQDDRSYSEFAHDWRPRVRSGDRAIITVEGHRCGFVNRFEIEPAGGGWWELGLVIFEPRLWGQGIGHRALSSWTRQTFQETDAHVLTLTTWSGNTRMMRCAEQLGYTVSARIPEARSWNGRRWDSITMSLLRNQIA
ncbi:GNAT family N-acetyltransferase [Acidipropionibacterium jensenii]|uniref:GNAT family N-acetyltransferase n=1 Tax=Acidipropionibacterium jensenii TaxID=1749 RepID=UPI0026492F55|nr:GNAT family protein [Acidipropionibacterium jensenii]MDN5977441.1 GNAT family N-acetyltransferase [Acidipropionibacterium jensenii]MDN5997436.1 GNAT family N-acetyltransferase [Acidipropionibacterium jensenii]MDN6427882.1 GNAT family N-acetyltransferase [Acidipropionibacterium jensenii]MDN6442644.1 GNAT family N-acetyltransferase [Acidipropionibacterium jensenii]MDN6480926.1 GNAT family N-acetyltransferase [Acidipropionibacterium jensenii]